MSDEGSLGAGIRAGGLAQHCGCRGPCGSHRFSLPRGCDLCSPQAYKPGRPLGPRSQCPGLLPCPGSTQLQVFAFGLGSEGLQAQCSGISPRRTRHGGGGGGSGGLSMQGQHPSPIPSLCPHIAHHTLSCLCPHTARHPSTPAVAEHPLRALGDLGEI